MHKYNYLVIVFALMLINSCTSLQKKSFISNFESFVADVETNYKTYKEKDWEEAELRYKNLIDVDYVKYQTSFTDEENKHVNTLIGKYQALKVKSSINGFKKGLNDIMEQVGAAVDEIASDTTLFKDK